MNNNDIFKKLRVALQLRDDQIVEILNLVDFKMSKGELGDIFRAEDHANFMECGDQVLRNFLNGLIIHLRGTKENPKNPREVIKTHKDYETQTERTDKVYEPKKPYNKTDSKTQFKPRTGEKKEFKPKTGENSDKKPAFGKNKFGNDKKPAKQNPVEKFKFKDGKK
ncbi:DUF1456 family protein [Flavobacterium sp.]|jgi:hypothetical protein|uniref:DUF1456 family protein n=1 Tax=Flavobacterium sp. TaxID=239 RepID=UPI0037BF4E14